MKDKGANKKGKENWLWRGRASQEPVKVKVGIGDRARFGALLNGPKWKRGV